MGPDEVMRVLDELDAVGVVVGITGGWGIDALLGRETREHGDLDLGVDRDDVDTVVRALGLIGYRTVADQRPARLELHAPTGRVDLHPIAWRPDGSGLQAGFDGRTFEYPVGSLSEAGSIGGRDVRCGTPELQVAFHLGYDPTDTDRRDLALLAREFGLVLPPPYGRDPATGRPPR
jgi:lincosamide nucleotidyltransferase A/C/D/E